jgi:hypothetical protein
LYNPEQKKIFSFYKLAYQKTVCTSEEFLNSHLIPPHTFSLLVVNRRGFSSSKNSFKIVERKLGGENISNRWLKEKSF